MNATSKEKVGLLLQKAIYKVKEIPLNDYDNDYLINNQVTAASRWKNN